MKKAVLFVPFWGQPGHVGNNRVDRFIRWLSKDGFFVIIVRAGAVDGFRTISCGQEITVRNPLGLYKDATDSSGSSSPPRKPNKLRRLIANLVFNPDTTVVWARVAAKHPAVVEAARGAKFILSSSPPESAHLGAWKLAQRLNIPHLLDMRDGWLDEPLKPLLRKSSFRRWQEGRIEKVILNKASQIFVTSDVWKELLCSRFLTFKPKVSVLTNGYPLESFRPAPNRDMNGELLIIHAGRFSGSDTRRTPDLLLRPLLESAEQKIIQGTIQLLGLISSEEITLIEGYKDKFYKAGWSLEYSGNLPRVKLLKHLLKADGLLLLSASYAAIPSKLFEYIPTGKPIFVVSERGSATWRICEQLPQAFLMDIREKDSSAPSRFLKAVASGCEKYEVPTIYSEEYTSQVMLNAIRKFS